MTAIAIPLITANPQAAVVYGFLFAAAVGAKSNAIAYLFVGKKGNAIVPEICR